MSWIQKDIVASTTPVLFQMTVNADWLDVSYLWHGQRLLLCLHCVLQLHPIYLTDLQWVVKNLWQLTLPINFMSNTFTEAIEIHFSYTHITHIISLYRLTNWLIAVYVYWDYKDLRLSTIMLKHDIVGIYKTGKEHKAKVMNESMYQV